MVEYTLNLDSVFGSLADPTRRDILTRVAQNSLSVSEIAAPYNLTFAAISKHLKVLEKARLIIKQRRGKQQFVLASPLALKDAANYLEQYGQMTELHLDSLENYLKEVELGKN